MPLLAELSPLDEYLLNRVDVVLAKPIRLRSPRISIRDNNGYFHVINPVTVLRIIVRGSELHDLLEEDADYEPLATITRGKLRGGGKAERDRWFGYENDAEFKRWWHRISKKDLGRDLKSKEEADHWHKVYQGSQCLLANSILYAYISLLSFREKKSARRLLSILSVEVFLALQPSVNTDASSIKPAPRRLI